MTNYIFITDNLRCKGYVLFQLLVYREIRGKIRHYVGVWSRMILHVSEKKKIFFAKNMACSISVNFSNFQSDNLDNNKY